MQKDYSTSISGCLRYWGGREAAFPPFPRPKQSPSNPPNANPILEPKRWVCFGGRSGPLPTPQKQTPIPESRKGSLLWRTFQAKIPFQFLRTSKISKLPPPKFPKIPKFLTFPKIPKFAKIRPFSKIYKTSKNHAESGLNTGSRLLKILHFL